MLVLSTLTHIDNTMYCNACPIFDLVTPCMKHQILTTADVCHFAVLRNALELQTKTSAWTRDMNIMVQCEFR